MFEMMIEAARYYRSCLNASPQALAYLRGRGLTDRTIATFGLGYCPDSYGLIKHLTEKGFDRKMMFDCSLLGERDGEYYDFQTGRAIVPIFDAYGKVIGFGGRVLVKKEGVAKYKNSRDTLLFDKKRVLYGLNYVKKSKIGNPIKDIILVEGYMDVIGLYQAGVKNAVASMGTMLTDLQAKALKAMVDTVYICYDGDFAGQTSTLRGLDILKKHDLDVRVMTLPEGKDPDEMVRDHGIEGFMQCKKQALPLYEYLLHRAKQEQDMTSAAGKSAYVKRALEIIGELDPIEREVYVNEIAKESGVSRSRLLSSLPASQKSAEKAAWQEEAQSTALETPQSAQEKPKYKNAERFVLSYLLENPLDENRFFEENLLRDETRQRMHAYIMKCVAAGRTPDVSSVYLLEQCDKT